jgi:hypothetical protein
LNDERAARSSPASSEVWTGLPVKHDLFLCHTGSDKDWTRQLATFLENHRIGNRPIKVWFDEWDIDYGLNIISKIDEGLRESRYVGLVLSPAMIRAPWPTIEWQSQVMDDPAGRSGRILPLLLKKFDESGAPIELPFILKPLKRFDFTEARKHQKELERLVRKLGDLPPSRGAQIHGRAGAGTAPGSLRELGQEAPDAIEESLSSNLLPVTALPKTLFSDGTTAQRKQDVWDNVKGRTPPFFIHGQRLYSFVAPSASKNFFTPFLVGRDQKSEPTSTWLSDPVRARDVIGMLNGGLRQHCHDLNIWTAKRDRGLFYPPIFEGAAPRKFTWGTGKFRTLAIIKPSTKEGGASFGVHMAARMRFMLLGQTLYLLIVPAWMFTTDGIKAVEGKQMGVFSTKWGGRERNAALLRNVLMWGLLIAGGQREIAINLGTAAAQTFVKLQSVPAHTRINVGIFGDAIRLDRILSGEGAGERKDIEELEEIANLALLGEPTADDADGRTLDDSDEEDAQALSLGL